MRRQLRRHLFLLFELLHQLYRLREVLLVLHSRELALRQVLFALFVEVIYFEVLGDHLVCVIDSLHFLMVLLHDLSVHARLQFLLSS